MHTELCDRFGIEFPISAFSHCRDVVAGVSRAGGFGVLGALAFPPDQLEIELTWIDDRVGEKPYGDDSVIPNKHQGTDEVDAEKLEAMRMAAAECGTIAVACRASVRCGAEVAARPVASSTGPRPLSSNFGPVNPSGRSR